jgi:hypothetical protein
MGDIDRATLLGQALAQVVGHFQFVFDDQDLHM